MLQTIYHVFIFLQHIYLLLRVLILLVHFFYCQSDPTIAEAVNAMKVKWLNYYSEFPDIYLIAMVFDPRCKLVNLSYYLNGYYGKECLNIEYDVDACCDRVNKILHDLYDEYVTFYGSSLNLDSTRTRTASQPASSSSSGFLNLGYSMLLKKTKKPRCSHQAPVRIPSLNLI